ncbi:Uncharacterised protein [uncultured archaeon]|nr:Uncharacterised protein [uncultured archaeon]
MDFPPKAIFAFNANIDHVRTVDEADLKGIEDYSPDLSQMISECFAWGVQKETAIDINACNFFLSGIKFDRRIVGGQAGNAAQQASALGVECYVHSNFANQELLSLFSHKEKIMVAGEEGFVPAGEFSSVVKSAHHFVLEDAASRTRFIATYDPFPKHLEDNFWRHIEAKLPQIKKAYIGGFHLLSRPERFHKFLAEVKRWKGINPDLQVFVELGEFQSKEVMELARKELFPVADIVGLNDTELAALGVDFEELTAEARAVLYHSPEQQRIFPDTALNAAALEFAKRCAAFKAKSGRFAGEKDVVGFDAGFVERPVETVGLGDAFSSAYFMAL